MCFSVFRIFITFIGKLLPNMKRTSELLEKRRRIVKEEVEAGKQKGVKISYTIDRLKERFLVSEKTLYNDLYHGTPDADEGKNKY